MKILSTVARYMLGLMFTVFGFNGFLHFIPLPPPATVFGTQYMAVMSASHYFGPIYFLEALAGILLLGNRFVPLALTLLGPILVNILMYHTLLNPPGVAPAVLGVILWVLVYWSVRSSFRGIFQPRPTPDPMA